VQVKPGTEMLAATQIASEKGIPIALLDRSIDTTMKRAFFIMPLLEKIRIVFYLLGGIFAGEQEQLTPEKIEELKKSDMVTKLVEELGQKAPTVKKVLVDERDAYISNQILKIRVPKLVCVVGAGHLNGIKELLLQEKVVDEKKLLELPKPGIVSKLVKWIVPLLFIFLLAGAFFLNGLSASINIILYWILITGVFSAIGAIIARSHAVSVLVAFVAAPLTTLHPFLASGWVAAAVEAKYKQPQVKDFEKLNQLNSYGDFEKNKVTHLLLVAAYTNLGSTIGVIIALPTLLSMLH
jgi:pheromone shutdown-related protein TraB